MFGNFNLRGGHCWGAVIIAFLLAILIFALDVAFGLSLSWGAAGLLHLPMTSLPWLAIPVVAVGLWGAVWIFRTSYAAELRNRASAPTAVDDFPAEVAE